MEEVEKVNEDNENLPSTVLIERFDDTEA